MATQYAGADADDGIEAVTFDTSTTSKDVEITFDDAAGITKDQLRDTVLRILQAIEQQDFPAA